MPILVWYGTPYKTMLFFIVCFVLFICVNRHIKSK